MRRARYLLLSLVFLLANLYLPRTPSRAARCDDVQFIFARGSGEALQGPSETAWRTELTKLLGTKSNLQYSFYELGSSPQGGSQYPAAAVSGSASGIGNLLGAYISAGSAFAFGRSVQAGRTELQNYLTKVSQTCPTTKFVLGGYSQGAMLITGSLPKLDAEKIIYVANFGDPKTYLPEGKGSRPVACNGKNLSNYRAYVSDCHAYEGVLGSVQPYQPPEYHNKLGLWCNAHDIMCSSGLNISDHSAYVRRGLYQNAAMIIASKIQQAFPEIFASTTLPAPSAHDMVILLNVGSVTQLVLVQYKSAAQAIANRTRSLGGRVALYAYSDYKKMLPQELCDFSCSAQEFNAELGKITHPFTTGENRESTLSTLRTAMNRLDWQVGATKSAVVLSPKPLDVVDRDYTTLQDVIDLSLKIDPVNVYAFTSTDYAKTGFARLTEPTNGAVYDVDTELNQGITEITGRPIATLSLEEYSGIVGDEFTFDASASLDFGKNLQFDWDLDADGSFETLNAGAVVYKTYTAPVSDFLQVKVTDDLGNSSTMSAKLSVTRQAPTLAKIINLRSEKVTTDTYRISFTTDAEKVLLIANDAVLGFVEQDFTLSDVTADLHLQLIPYRDDLRGERAELTLQPDTNPKPQPSTSTDATNSSSSTHLNPTSPSKILQIVQQVKLHPPKVPNTGVSM